MRIEIADRQKLFRIKPARLRAIVAFFMRRAFKARGYARWKAVSLVVTDNTGIRQVNRAVFSSNRTTDVISSSYTRIPGERSGLTGEIVVNVQAARGMAKAFSGNSDRLSGKEWDTSRELSLYIAHGCDHLSGENDATPATRVKMLRRELQWLREAERKGLLATALAAGSHRKG